MLQAESHRLAGDSESLRNPFFDHRGRHPSMDSLKDWREYGRSEWLPAKYCQSAKEVLRHMDQVAACCMSMADDVMVSNQRATPMDAIRIGKLSQPVFKELLALGIIPAELDGLNHEYDKNAA